MDLTRRVNRWLVAGAVSAAGFVSLVAGYAFHGDSVAVGGSGAISTAQQSQASPRGGGGLGSPAQAPTPAGAGPSAVVSGGS
jgi:hypothetical protein